MTRKKIAKNDQKCGERLRKELSGVVQGKTIKHRQRRYKRR